MNALTIELEQDYSFYCADCGEKVDVILKGYEIEVEPCSACLHRAEMEGYSDGRAG
jgi:hypothetical protein